MGACAPGLGLVLEGRHGFRPVGDGPGQKSLRAWSVPAGTGGLVAPARISAQLLSNSAARRLLPGPLTAVLEGERTGAGAASAHFMMTEQGSRHDAGISNGGIPYGRCL